MTEPRRVRVQGDLFHGRVPAGAVYVGRAAPWLPASLYANPFKVGAELSFPFSEIYGPVVRDRALAVQIFAGYAHITVGYEMLARRDLAGKDLACWCPLPAEGEPDICHAAVLLSIANAEPEMEPAGA